MDYFNLRLDPGGVQAVSTLGLAHLGDAVYELMVRSRLCVEGKTTSKGLHRATVARVSAPAQAAAARQLSGLLTPEEEAVFRRGRNANIHTVPKHAELNDYRIATAVEALFGWLYLNGEKERLCRLFDAMMDEPAGAETAERSE